ncbi:MAG: NAD-dependent epimerase/dehydratase family protein [Hungatella sp.]|nr:NAD-dependent epimerase/dehydratase family protein [Hungatella sp.]
MNILITGANGFIGNAVSNYFFVQNHHVIRWVKKNDKGEGKAVRLEDWASVLENLKSISPDIIIHCAGAANVQDSIKRPNEDFINNVQATHNLIFAMKKLEMRSRLVFLSSAGVYGNPPFLPVSERAPLNSMSPYALHKQLCEDICIYFKVNYGMDIKIARIFSAYGVGLQKQIFWDMFCKLKKTGRLDMYGTGDESRDYIYIDDLVKAIFLIATAESDESIFNVGNGIEIKISEAARLFAKEFHLDESSICFNQYVREGDPNHWKADVTLLKELQYHQSISFEEGIKKYCDWLKEGKYESEIFY